MCGGGSYKAGWRILRIAFGGWWRPGGSPRLIPQWFDRLFSLALVCSVYTLTDICHFRCFVTVIGSVFEFLWCFGGFVELLCGSGVVSFAYMVCIYGDTPGSRMWFVHNVHSVD